VKWTKTVLPHKFLFLKNQAKNYDIIPGAKCRIRRLSGSRESPWTLGNKIKLDAAHPVHDVVHMTAITYTAARENLASTMDRVCDDRDPVIITRNRDQAVVMLSLDDYESLQETAYLLRSPANAKRLFDAIEAAEKGNLIEKSLPDLEK